MTLGDLSPNLAFVPIVGSDQISVGLTPSTMHANPGTIALVPVAATATSPSLFWLALLAAAGWYAWKKGWLPV